MYIFAILDLSTRWWWVVSLTPWPVYIKDKEASVPNQNLQFCSYINTIHFGAHKENMNFGVEKLRATNGNLMSIVFSLGRLFKVSDQVRGLLWHFVIRLFLRWEVVSPTLNPPSWRTTPCQMFPTTSLVLSQLSFIGRLLHPQPEGVSCLGDKGHT